MEKIAVQKQMCCDQKCSSKASVWYPTKWCKSYKKVCVKSDRCKKYSYQYYDTNKCAEYETKYYTTGECVQVWQICKYMLSIRHMMTNVLCEGA